MDYTGFIVMGSRWNLPYVTLIGVTYEPTQDQIRNLQTLFGWDYVRKEDISRTGHYNGK